MTDIAHSGRVVRAGIRTTASAERAWEAWADPDRIVQWFADEAHGKCEVGATLEWVFHRFDVRMAYKVMFVERGSRIVLGPVSAESPMVLEIQIEEKAGETVVHVINSGLSDDVADESVVAGIESGWHMALGILKHYLENYFGKDRRSFVAFREAEFNFDSILSYYRDGFKLAKWLTNEGAIIEGKPSVRLVLRDGRPITGTVLAETPREVAISWEEIDGVLELKSFVQDDRKMVCIRGCGWGLSAEECRVIEASMEGALDRLVAALLE